MGTYKGRLIIILIILSLSVGLTYNNIKNRTIQEDNDFKKIITKVERKEYRKIVENFTKINMDDIEKITSESKGKEVYLYFGRETCQYCRSFVIENKELLKGQKDFYYIDTEKLSNNEKKTLKKYGICEVPMLLEASSNTNISEKDIDDFIKEKYEKF